MIMIMTVAVMVTVIQDLILIALILDEEKRRGEGRGGQNTLITQIHGEVKQLY